MQIIRAKNLSYIPASHEDPNDPGVLKKVLLTKDDLTPGRVQMINWARLPIGRTFQAHYHEDMDEIFIVMEGKASMQVNEERAVLERGDAVVVSQNHTHSMTNVGEEDVFYIVMGITREQNGKTVVVTK